MLISEFFRVVGILGHDICEFVISLLSDTHTISECKSLITTFTLVKINSCTWEFVQITLLMIRHHWVKNFVNKPDHQAGDMTQGIN